MSDKAKKTVKTVVDVVLWVFLIVALLMTIWAFYVQASSNGMPTAGGKSFLTVLTDSMSGPRGFEKGDLIIDKVLTTDEMQNLNIDDVITYYMDITPDNGVDDKVLNSHRIIDKGINAAGEVIYYTKGDYNEFPDNDPVLWSNIKGLWTGTRIPVAGSVIGFLQSRTGFLVCIVIPMFLFFLYELFVLFTTIQKIRSKGKKQISAEDEELIKQRAVEEYLRRQALVEQLEKEKNAENAAPADTTENKDGQ